MQAIRRLLLSHAGLHIIPQNLVEFWAVATRPSLVNGLGLTSLQANAQLAVFKSSLLLLPDVHDVFAEWERIVSAYGVQGRQAHDARLVAAMKAHSLTHLLTFNVADFKRYETGEQITVVEPATVTIDI